VVDGDWRRAGAEEVPCEQRGNLLGLGVLANSSDPGGRE
jgi:hypothetical protein